MKTRDGITRRILIGSYDKDRTMIARHSVHPTNVHVVKIVVRAQSMSEVVDRYRELSFTWTAQMGG